MKRFFIPPARFINSVILSEQHIIFFDAEIRHDDDVKEVRGDGGVILYVVSVEGEEVRFPRTHRLTIYLYPTGIQLENL